MILGSVVLETRMKLLNDRKHLKLKTEWVVRTRSYLFRTQSQMATLRSKISLLEAQLKTERDRARNLQDERDEAVKALVAVSEEVDALKSENKALKAEIVNLKRQIHESLKQAQLQKPITVKERIKERVEIERKKEHDQRKRVEREKKEEEGNRSFIQVSHTWLS